MKDRGSRKRLEENRDKVKERGKDVREEEKKEGKKGGKLIDGCYQSEICQSVASHSAQLPH